MKRPRPEASPECGAMYRDGRWTWGAPPFGAHEALCPACHPIRDDYPGGHLALAGDFLGEHREHPLERIMRLDDAAEGGMEITTTDPVRWER